MESLESIESKDEPQRIWGGVREEGEDEVYGAEKGGAGKYWEGVEGEEGGARRPHGRLSGLG